MPPHVQEALRDEGNDVGELDTDALLLFDMLQMLIRMGELKEVPTREGKMLIRVPKWEMLPMLCELSGIEFSYEILTVLLAGWEKMFSFQITRR